MKIKNCWKKIIAWLMAIITVIGLVPAGRIPVHAEDTKSVSMKSLGKLGSVDVGSKTKSGTWWKISLSDHTAFCMDLGYTCHSGNKYEKVSSKNWSQETRGKDGQLARIIYWYDTEQKRSQKAFVMSQALLWGIAEGQTSEGEIKKILKAVQDNIGYYSGDKTDTLYKNIFETKDNFTAKASYWKKTGNSASYQQLLTVDSSPIKTPDYKSVSNHRAYRQRITVTKKDEEGHGLKGIKFSLSAKDIDHLQSFRVKGLEDSGSVKADDDDGDDLQFEISGKTRDSGKLAFRMTYRITSKSYAYYPDADLKKMSDAEKKAAKKQLTDDGLDEGKDFGKNMTKAEAEKLIDKELDAEYKEIKNEYVLKEVNLGGNDDLIMDSDYAKGKKITLKTESSWVQKDGSWPDEEEKEPSDYTKAYQVSVTNHHTKYQAEVVKKNNKTKDGKAIGGASLAGAEYHLYSDAGCKTIATVYGADKKTKKAGAYTTDKNGTFTTDYLVSGRSYYLKETKAPKGFKLSTEVKMINESIKKASVEYSKEKKSVSVGDDEIFGKIEIKKVYKDPDTAETWPEQGAKFQVYLKSKKSYDACPAEERALITTDAKGYGKTGDLPYGTYVIHQISAGSVDALLVKDFEATISEEKKDPYTYDVVNPLYKAYLKMIKRDGTTKKEVLKSGTAYQIYKVTDGKEELIKQQNPETKEQIDTFFSDDKGEIMTYERLRSGTYRIYETSAVTGYHITTPYVEITFDSHSDNHESYTDKDGAVHDFFTVNYTNEETYGKLKIKKTGEMLTGWDAESHKFIYENRILKGVTFEAYADEDIVVQDNQGGIWFKKGDKVATILSGQKAEFTNECSGICTQEVDEEGIVTLTLPLGKYVVREVKTVYGYILPDKTEWPVEFTWKNGTEEYVLNSTDSTDDQGQLNVNNGLAKPLLHLTKQDRDSKEVVPGTVFGLYTTTPIYNVDGQKIVEADTQLTTVTTGVDAVIDMDMWLPLMDQGYVTGTAAPIKEMDGKKETEETKGTEGIKETEAKEAETTETVSTEHTANTEEGSGQKDGKTDTNKEMSLKAALTKDDASSDPAGADQEQKAGPGQAEASQGAGSGQETESWPGSSKPTESGTDLNQETENTEESSEPTAPIEAQKNVHLNSGDYYFKELSVSSSYYLDDTPIPVHLEYKDEHTQVIEAKAVKENVQTTNEISKISATGGKEVDGCALVITGQNGEKIISWISGDKDSVKIHTKKDYVNLNSSMDTKGNLIVRGLHHDEIYKLTETRPADGYVTANSIVYKLTEKKDKEGLVRTVVMVKDKSGKFVARDDDKTIMVDEETHIRLLKIDAKSGQSLPGAKFKITDSKGKEVMSFTTDTEAKDITGKLKVGETYTFTETEAPAGYKLAAPVKYTVKDTSKVQSITVKDEKKPHTPPQTGEKSPIFPLAGGLLVSLAALAVMYRRRKRI